MLYIKANHLTDGLYNIKGGEIFKYKAKGGTVRTYEIGNIVRCKECKYKRIYDGETKYYYCALEDRPNRQWSIDETDYCSWGERDDSYK